jgi:hypothetical protein
LQELSEVPIKQPIGNETGFDVADFRAAKRQAPIRHSAEKMFLLPALKNQFGSFGEQA